MAVQQELKVVKKCLATLANFAYEKDQWGPRELARSLGIGKSSALRLLQTLERGEFLTRERETGKYGIGPNLWRLAVALYSKLDLVAIGRPLVEEYVKEINETMYIFTHNDHKVIIQAEVECSHPLRYHLKLGFPYDVHRGATGKTILANLPPEDSKKVLHDLKKDPSVNVKTLMANLKSVKLLGYAFSEAERVQGVVGFAAPVRGAGNTLLGGVAILIPKARYNSKKHDIYATFIRRCAASISSAFSTEQDKSSPV